MTLKGYFKIFFKIKRSLFYKCNLVPTTAVKAVSQLKTHLYFTCSRIELIICWTSAANDQNSAYQNHLKRSTFLAGPGKKQTRKHPGQGRIYKTICALMSSLYYVYVYGLSCRDFRKKYVCFKFSVYLPVKINLFLHSSIHYNWHDFLKIW